MNFTTFNYTVVDYISFDVVTLEKVNLRNKDFDLMVYFLFSYDSVIFF